MAGRWYIQQTGDDRGPYTFSELTALVQKGELTHDDSLRKEGSSLYIGATRINGLFSVAFDDSTVSASAPEPPLSDSEVPKRQRRSSIDGETWMSQVPTSRLALGGVATLLVGIGLALWIEYAWQTRGSRRFPDRADLSQATPVAEMVKARLDQLRPPRPNVPSITGLEIGVPVPIPGLENVAEGFSPTLTDDMKRIVFAALSTGGYDLFEASRNDVTASFENPQRIGTCSTPDLEAYPALSHDGLKLLFIRSEASPKIVLAQRTALGEEFETPVECVPEGLDGESSRVGYPQFYGTVRAAFLAWSGTPPAPHFQLADISSSSSTWIVSEELPFPNSYPAYRICSNGLRAYYGWPEGLGFVVRKRITDDFSLDIEMLPASNTGPMEGSVWIAPQEDIAFYCSPGPGKEIGQRRQLWMVRF